MKINFESLTDHELADIITAAAEEWQLRQPRDHRTVVNRNPAMQPKVVTIDEPAQRDKDFVLHVKAKAASGELIRAAERRGVASIAENFPEWVIRQGLPTEGGTSAWRDIQHQMKIGQAREL